MEQEIKSERSILKRFWYLWAIIIVAALAAGFFYWQYSKPAITITNNNQSQIAASPETFAVYGDSRTGNDIHREIVGQIVALNPKFVFHTGDMVSDGNSQADWDTFKETTQPIFSKLYPALGNHEGNSELYFETFNLPNNERWYSVQSDFVYFIILDSNIPLDAGSEQMTWLNAELTKAQASHKFIAAVFHHPPFSSADHGQDADVLKLQTDLVPILEANHLNLAFNGHDHDYERSYKDGIYYLTAGGGGAPLYKQKFANRYSQKFVSDYDYAKMIATADKLQINVYNASGAELDNLTVSKSK